MNERSSNSFSLTRRYAIRNYSLAPTSTRILSFATVRSFKSLIAATTSTRLMHFFLAMGLWIYLLFYKLFDSVVSEFKRRYSPFFRFFFFFHLSFHVSKSSDIRTTVADSTPLIVTLKPSLYRRKFPHFAYE